MGAVSNIGALGSNIHPQVKLLWEQVDKNPPEIIKKFAVADGSILRIVEGYRHPNKQKDLVEKGVSKAGPCASYHNWGLAVDVVFRRFGFGTGIVDGEIYNMATVDGWLKTGFPQYMESLGFVWGGRFTVPDCGHFELPLKVPKDRKFAYLLGNFLGVRWWTQEITEWVDVSWHQHNKVQPVSKYADVFSGFTGKVKTFLWVGAVVLLWNFFKE